MADRGKAFVISKGKSFAGKKMRYSVLHIADKSMIRNELKWMVELRVFLERFGEA